MNLNSEWQELAQNIARGYTSIGRREMVQIMTWLNFDAMNSDFLPKGNLADRNTNSQKWAAVNYVVKLWDVSIESLAKIELGWVEDVIRRHGKSLDDEKKSPEELVTPQILARVIAVAHTYYLAQNGKLAVTDQATQYLCQSALNSLNVFVASSCLKGDTREVMVEVEPGVFIPAYNALRKHGVLIGASGKYLPDPVASLPLIFSMFHRDSLREVVYVK